LVDITTTEGAPPIVRFDGWEARTPNRSRYEDLLSERAQLEACASHPSKIAKGGAATFGEVWDYCGERWASPQPYPNRYPLHPLLQSYAPSRAVSFLPFGEVLPFTKGVPLFTRWDP
jgi:hypothetical protein